MLRTTSDTEKWVISRFNCSQTWTNFLELNLTFFAHKTKLENFQSITFHYFDSVSHAYLSYPCSLVKSRQTTISKGACKKKKKNDSITFQNACKLKIVTEKNLQLRDKTRVTSTCSIKLIKELQFAIIMMTNKFLI